VTESIRVSNTTYNASGNLTTYGIGAEIPLDGKIVLRLLVESADNKNIEGATVAHIGLMTRF
jgi:PII-like signaling protein